MIVRCFGLLPLPAFWRLLIVGICTGLPLAGSATALEQPDLSGTWTFELVRGREEVEQLGTVAITQDGPVLEGAWSDLSRTMRDEFGFEKGDTALMGRIEDGALRGQIRLRYPIENRDACPGKWETWEPLELALPENLSRLQGRFRNSAMSPRDCSVEDLGWLFFTLAREDGPGIAGEGPTRARAGVLAESAFDNGNEGWVLGDHAGAIIGVAPYVGEGGNPGGHLGVPDEPSGEAIYWDAPIAFLGDRSSAYGGILLFDLEPGAEASTPEVVLAGEGVEIVPALERPEGPNWSTYSVRLAAEGGWSHRASGDAATEAEMRRVLSLVSSLRIKAAAGVGLDNVVLGGEVEVADEPVDEPEDPVPHRVEIALADLSAIVGRAMNLQVFLVNANDQQVPADKVYEIRLTAEGGVVRPGEVVIPDGAKAAAARVYGERPGPVPIRAAASDPILGEGEVTGIVCDLAPIARLVFNVEREESPVGRSIEAKLHLVGETGTEVSDDGARKRIAVKIGGVGRSPTPNLGWIEEGRCMTLVEIISDRPGESPVSLALGKLEPERRILRFYLPLTPLVFAVVGLGGLLGGFSRAATVWRKAQRWKAPRWVVTLTSGVIAGLAVFLVYHFAVVEALPRLSGGLGLILLLSLIGGYLGPTAIDRIADYLLPSKA